MGILSVTILVVAFVAIAAGRLTPAEENQIFSDFVDQHKIRLGRSSNVEASKKNLLERYYKVEEHNRKFRAGETTYEMGLDETAIDNEEDVLRKRTGLLPKPDNYTDNSLPASADVSRSARAAPASIDWRTYTGVVRPVQSQGSCGSCWAFAAIGALEGQLSRIKNRHDKLSEQEVIECAKNSYTGKLLGCNGGWDFSAYEHARAKYGVTYASTRPYTGSASKGCVTSTARVPGSRPASVTYYKITAGNEAQMKEYLANKGPLYVTIYVTTDFNNYRSGIFTDTYKRCGNYYNNHAVLLVGYGTQNGVDYWIIKNSWGTWWGESGFMRLKRGVNLCGIAKDVSYPKLE